MNLLMIFLVDKSEKHSIFLTNINYGDSTSVWYI